MQFLANKEQDVGILGTLLDRLKEIGSIDDTIHSATFISSLEEFPSKKGGESQGNLLWVTNPMLPTIEPGFVYQFRFTPNEIIEIDQTAEEELKAAANITDISSLIPSLKEEPLAIAQPEPTKPAVAVNSAPALTTGTPPIHTETQDFTPTKLEATSTAPANK